LKAAACPQCRASILPPFEQPNPLGQTLIVTAGCGRVQREGGPIKSIHPGDLFRFRPARNLRMSGRVTPHRHELINDVNFHLNECEKAFVVMLMTLKIHKHE
jgi:hypothetical protein